MNYHYYMSIFLNHSIVIPAILGLVRFRHILSTFYPFIWLIWLGTLNETLSLLMIHTRGSNTVNSNVFVLLEYLLILLQFFKWNNRGRRTYLVLAALGVGVWIADNAIIHHIYNNNSLFRVCAAFTILFISIDQANKVMIFEPGKLWKNAIFLVCLAFVFYFGLKAFIEAFNVFPMELAHEFLLKLWSILYFVNCITNLFYAAAILCIPTKQELTWLY